MHFVSEIKKVSSFLINSQINFYWKGTCLFDINFGLLETVNGNIFKVFKEGNKFIINYFSNDDGMEMSCSFEILGSFKSSKINDRKSFLSEINNSYSVELSYDLSFNTLLDVINFEGKKIIENIINPFGFKLLDSLFLEWDKQKLDIYELNTGLKLFEFSFSKLSTYITDGGEEKSAELISILGVYKTVLWILVTERRIVGLDTETGTLLHEINLCEALGLKPQTVENYSFSLGDTHLDEEKEKIKGFAHRYYWELDLNSLQAVIKVDFGEGNTWRIKKSKFYQGDKNIYFTGARSGETFDRAIGIFDTDKLEITWYDEPLGEGRYSFFTDIQANDKLIGALDSEQNLRIYERE